MSFNNDHWADYIRRLEEAKTGKCPTCGGHKVVELRGDGMECAPTGYHCPECDWGVGS